MKKIIVLMSTYNGEKYLYTQIKTILDQQQVKLELIIRDDGSTDGTIDIIQGFKDPRIVLIRGNNCGCSSSFFKLLSYANEHYGDDCFFAFADQDDYWLPLKLWTAINKLNNLDLSKPSLYISNLYIAQEDLKVKQLLYRKPIDLSKQHAMIENHATGCTMVFNKIAIKYLLSTDTTSYRIHDIPMFIHCLFFGNVVYDEESYILYRQHRGNLIGAGVSFRQRLISKKESILNFVHQHQKENDMKVLFSQMESKLCEGDKCMFKIITDYRKNLRFRLILLFSHKYHKLGFVDNIFFKLRVILGHV